MGDVVNTGAVACEKEGDEQATSVVGIDGEEQHQTCAQEAEVVAILEVDASLEAVRIRQAVSIQVEAEVEAGQRAPERDSA
jgi:hypothetical protein